MQLEWKPESGDKERLVLVRAHLRDLLDSDTFRGKKRAQDFLKLVVEHAMAGRSEHLRERMLGAEMFGRPIDYDTANDAVVRVKATEVRKELTRYYLSLRSSAPVRIDLPLGSYVPRFYFDFPLVDEPAPSPTPDSEPPKPDPELRQVEEPPSSRGRSFRTEISMAIFLVAGGSLLATTAFFAVQRWRQSNTSQPIRSIAILPLTNLSGDPRQQYFADGMTEELTNELGQVATLRVTSRTSTMSYKESKKNLLEIARELNVDGIVEGSVAREGNRVRVTTQLIDARNDKHIWAHSYEREMTSVLGLEGDVARAIAEQIQIELTPQQQVRFSSTQRVNPEALDLYLQAVQRFNTGNPKAAAELLRRSIERDPGYAPAHMSLASAYGWMGEAGLMPYGQAFSFQKAEALKAIALDDSRAEPHLDLGFASLNQEWDWATPAREFSRALELNPNSAPVLWANAYYMIRIGRANVAISEAKLALQLDPVSTDSYMNTGFIFYYAHQYDQALTQIRHAEGMHPDPTQLLFPMGVIDVEMGLFDEGIQEFKKIGDWPHALGHMGNAYARQGRTAEARAILPKLTEHIEKTGVGRYEIALVYAGLKDKDNAFDWLEKAYQVRDKGLTYLKIDPCLDPLRSDPRFQSLLQRVGFPTNK